MWQEVWKIKCIKRKREWCLNLADIIIHQFLVTVKKFYASEKMDLKYADNHWYVNLSLCLKEKLKKIFNRRCQLTPLINSWQDRWKISNAI